MILARAYRVSARQALQSSWGCLGYRHACLSSLASQAAHSLDNLYLRGVVVEEQAVPNYSQTRRLPSSVSWGIFLPVIPHRFCWLAILRSMPLFSPPRILPSVWACDLKPSKNTCALSNFSSGLCCNLPDIQKQKARKFSLGGWEWQGRYRGMKTEKKISQLVTFFIINEINADSLLETQHSDYKSHLGV